MFNWTKLGHVYGPQGQNEWDDNSFMTPVAFQPNEAIIRVFGGVRDKHGVSRIGMLDLDANTPTKILKVYDEPVLGVGIPGAFDDNGVVPISILQKGGELYLYYIGFQLGVKVRYYMFCGLAVSTDMGLTFKRVQQTPVMDRIGDDLFARAGVSVLEGSKGTYHAWYVGSIKDGWCEKEGKQLPLYKMKHMTSTHFDEWHKEGEVCLEFANEDEYGFGRPWVWKTPQNQYRMFYSTRTFSKGHVLGYAESEDGQDWSRKDDQAGMTLSTEGWDSLHMTYPFLIKNKAGRVFMFYNGNNFGETGFGVAEGDARELGL